MTLQYSNINNPPGVLNVPSGGTYANPLSGTDTNSLNVPTSQLQSIGPVARGGSRRRRHSRRHRQSKKTRRGGATKRRRVTRRRK